METLNEVYEKNDLPRLAYRTAAGGSDAAYTTEAGIPTVDDVGVEGFYIHSSRECALLSSLAESAKRLAAVAYRI